MKNRKEIWIVDDNTDHCELAMETIRDVTKRFPVECKANGEIALLELLASCGPTSKLPSLILMDIKMPRQNGIETLKKIKRNLLLRTIPVVILSTSSSATEVEECLSSGAEFHLTKPLNHDDVTAKILPVLERKIT